MARYALTIFLSAFLLFLVQPLIGKHILPWFGGTPAVWTTCMLFFQAVLLGGYAYAHLLADRFSPRKQGTIHLALLALSLVFLPIAPREFLKPTGTESPQLQILLLLLLTIGGPYLMLSTTGPLLQSWFSRAQPGRSPYRLYSLSNAGSLLALLSYPFLLEPNVRLWHQVVSWSVGYALFVMLCGWCAFQLRKLPDAANVALTAATSEARTAAIEHGTANARPVSWSDITLWLLLSMAGSVMLLATTNMICQEISVVPFLWIGPLALYLSSFIICFDNERWYVRWLFLPLLGVAIIAWWLTLGHEALVRLIMAPGWLNVSPLARLDSWVFNQTGNWLDAPSLRDEIAIYLIVLFACVMACHGELARSKPQPRHLTLFYLMIATGGALGGVFVALIAPNVFPWFWEYQVGLLASCVAVLWAVIRDRRPATTWVGHAVRWGFDGSCLLVIPLAATLVTQVRLHDEDAKFVQRNFYGVLRVTETEDDDHGPAHTLMHGEINHGVQYLDPVKRRWATSYYGPDSGISIATRYHPRRFSDDPKDRGIRIGVVGLGTGSTAALGQEGDYVRFYEINPAVLGLSDKGWFTYINDTPAKVDVILGDARVSMERELAEGSQRFDVLAVDAFSSDSIPMHLLTVECANVYWRHLKPDGILALHISNRYLDLSGVAQALADEYKKQIRVVDCDDDPETGQSSSTWVLITSNEAFLTGPEMRGPVADATPATEQKGAAPVRWTDDFGSLWQVLDLD
ncbi:MAG: fused MFS/spermidine synthase [Planctomycetes bacterium]|nr:fused MFS/spermidine synthase [Planctomycetota bacterium]